MNDLRVGRIIRAVRIHVHLRQSDVGRLADCGQSVISLLEHGRLDEASLRTLRRVCTVLEIDLALDARWRGGAIDRLLDQGHAAIVEYAARLLVRNGWIVDAELTFNEYGERGSVDVVAWHPEHRALLLVEVKTALTDLQAMLLSMSRKVRIVPGILTRERGWHRRHLGRVLVVAGTTANRSTVAQHRAMFEATFPEGSRDARAWLANPTSDLAAVWFVSQMAVSHATTASRRRVRVARAQTSAD